MLENAEDVLELGDSTSFSRFNSQQQPVLGHVHIPDMHSGGSLFPLAMRPPTLTVHDEEAHAHSHAARGPWLHHHPHPSHLHGGGSMDHGTCGAASSCTSNHHDEIHHHHHHHHDRHGHGDSHQSKRSLQHLLAVGSRQWGSGGWWDGRSMLRVKIYDFAIYADADKAASVLRNAASSASAERPRSLTPGAGAGSGLGGAGSGLGGACDSASPSPCPTSPTDLLVPASSGVGMSLTIRACRNLPLPLLAQEFERILQRRHAKAGGRPDDPALRELLSYFSRDRLPRHVIAPGGGGPGGGGQEADAVRKGAAITFSRSSGGELVTEAGGQVLGRLVAPPLAEALFDLYLGDQPVSKRAKAAAGEALLRLAETDAGGRSPPGLQAASASAAPGRFPSFGSSSSSSALGAAPGERYRYRLQPGERLHCGPGAGPHTPDACLLEMP